MTPPSKITVSAGIDQMTNSTRPSYDSSRLRVARAFDDRYHQANAKVARITGTTTTSMIAVELIRRSRSAEAIGPCGSNRPAGAQEVRRMAAPTAGQRSKRERRGPYRKPVFLTGRLNMANSSQPPTFASYPPFHLITFPPPP